MKKTLSALMAVTLLLAAAPVLPKAAGAGTSNVIQIDTVTYQGNGAYHPEQIAVERTLQPGAKITERYRMTPLPAERPYAIALASGGTSVYVSDRKDGSIWEVEPDSGKVIRQFSPSSKPSTEIQGLATGMGEDIFVYYNGEGTIQRLTSDGYVSDSFKAPTIYGHSMTYNQGFLYLLDDMGYIYQINASTHLTVATHRIYKPDGSAFTHNETFSIMWDGKYWNISYPGDNWKLYRYTEDWGYHDTVDLEQWNISGCVFNGREYWVMNNDKKWIFSIRPTDDVSGKHDTVETPHYQYIDNILTTEEAAASFPQYEDRNVLVLYNDPQKITREYLKPYTSYLDSTGKRAGTMFDSFIFLPSSSRHEQFIDSQDTAYWSEYIAKSMNDMAVLDQEWGSRNQELNRQDKAKVYLSVPYPARGLDLEQRKNLVHDYVEEALAALSKQKPSNISFKGFYWHNEDAEFAEELVIDFNQYVHQKGFRTIWIPYYDAYEVSDHSVLGFDQVYQQPNHYFKHYNHVPTVNRFFYLTWTGTRYKTAVEFELDEKILSTDPEYRKLFTDYLHYGLVNGFLGASKAWYDNTIIGVLYNRRDPLYNTIHEAIAGTYSESNVLVNKPQDGVLQSSRKVSFPETAKIRLNVIGSKPYSIQKVVIHTDNSNANPMSFVGTLRVDEELAVVGGKLIKQELGQTAEGMRIGFIVPINQQIQVSIVPEGMTPFSDIPRNHPAIPAVLSLVDIGVLNGFVENGQVLFKPSGSITRAQFATMLARAYKLTPVGSVTFGDSQNNWYSAYVAAVSEKGYMNGYDANNFGPEDSITQEQVTTIMVRILQKMNVTGSKQFSEQDLESVSDWAREYVKNGQKMGVITDKFGSSSFKPQDSAARIDVADVLYKALQMK